MNLAPQRLAWLVATVALIAGLIVLDSARGGPATLLSRCNLALSRSSESAADVLVVGSSRTGTAIDPVAMQSMLRTEPALDDPTVERIALGRSPLQASVALLENYLDRRGDPEVVVLEVSFLIDRTLEKIEALDSSLAADETLFRRDINLMTYEQLLDIPAVAQPLTEQETATNRLRHSLRGVTLRSGALAYQFAHQPAATFSFDECDVDDWTREPTWPADFAFSWGETDRVERPADQIESLRVEAEIAAADRSLQPWQVGRPTDRRYPYDVEADYRAGELALLDRAVAMATDRDIAIVLMLLPIYGTHAGEEDIEALTARYDGQVAIYDIYGDAGVDLSTYWYDDAHLQPAIAGELATALLAQYLIDGPLNNNAPPSAET